MSSVPSVLVGRRREVVDHGRTTPRVFVRRLVDEAGLLEACQRFVDGAAVLVAAEQVTELGATESVHGCTERFENHVAVVAAGEVAEDVLGGPIAEVPECDG